MPQNIDHDGEEPRPAELERLSREVAPPGALEDRVVAALKDEGLIGTGRSAPARPSRRGRWIRRTALAASLLLVSALGFAGGVMMAPGPGQADYILLLRPGGTRNAVVDEAEEMRRVEEYSRWYRDGLARGEMAGGEKLEDGAAAVLGATGAGGSAVRGGEKAGNVQGFFLIRAESDQEAERIASTCPHLSHGGVIEIRKIARIP